MKRVRAYALASLVLVTASLPLAAETWYIRKDGGSLYSSSNIHGQCNGKVNTAYPGRTNAEWTPATTYSLGTVITDNVGHYETVTTAGTSGTGVYAPSWAATTTDGTVTWTQGSTYPVNQSCAVNHPWQLVALSNTDPTWLTAAGDTIQFEDTGPYYMGQHNNTTGRGFTWAPMCDGTGACDNNLPSMVLPANTKIYGYGVGNCHQTDPNLSSSSALTAAWSGHGELKNATKLVGINGLYTFFDLQGSTGPDLECLDMSQPDTCTIAGTPTVGKCVSGQDFGVNGIIMETSTNQGPIDATLKDIAIHGLASSGILGGKLNTSSADTFTADDIYLVGNGSAGWTWDGGSCGTSCQNIGTLTFNWIRIDWNGCVEVQPDNGELGSNGYNYCTDDNVGGYGDGWALISTTGTWTMNHGIFRWNTQDGFDSLHVSDNGSSIPVSFTLENSWSEGNMGQTFKLGNSTTTLADNNVSISNCRRLDAPFSPNPSGYNTNLSDFCRAAGDEWAIVVGNTGTAISLIHNTSVGYGATMYDLTCSSCTGAVIFKDNISVGYPDPGNSNALPGGFYITTDPFANAGSAVSYNDWYNMRHKACPQNRKEEHSVCANPDFKDSNIDSFNPSLLPRSPAIRAGTVIPGLTTDLGGSKYANPPSVGALQPQ